jgi:hypothetical protein
MHNPAVAWPFPFCLFCPAAATEFSQLQAFDGPIAETVNSRCVGAALLKVLCQMHCDVLNQCWAWVKAITQVPWTAAGAVVYLPTAALSGGIAGAASRIAFPCVSVGH